MHRSIKLGLFWLNLIKISLVNKDLRWLNLNKYKMFGSDKNKLFKERKDTERSLISETVSIDGTVNSSGAIDIAGLIKGPVYSKEVVIKDTGSISGDSRSRQS